MSAPNLDQLRSALKQHRGKQIPLQKIMRHAAVAAVLRQNTELELLFIRRAEQERDPWSGHMAFPGGRVDDSDFSPFAAAVRETQEEVDLNLELLGTHEGTLSQVPATARGKGLPLVIHPFVFSVKGDPELSPQLEEVAETHWVPVSFLLNPDNRQSMERTYAGVTFNLPCYHYQERVIWGLTLKMADELLSLLKGKV